jgi:hypothetical protein
MSVPVIVASIAGGVVVKGADILIKVLKDSRAARTKDREAERKYQKQDESEILARMEALLNRAERNLEDSQRREQRAVEREQRAIQREQRASIKAERAVVWIKHLESRLRENNIPFDAWVDEVEPEPAKGRGDAETDVDDGRGGI